MPKKSLAELEAQKAALLDEQERQRKEAAQKLADLKKKIRQAKAEQAKEERKAEAKKLILIGAAVQKAVAFGSHGLSQEVLAEVLASYLERESDRKLFGLPPA